MKFGSQLRYLRLKPFDSGTEAGRADERHRRAVLSAIVSVAARIVSLGVLFLTVPLTLHYLGKERYGMWMVMSSTLGLMTVADLGLGNGLLNFVAKARGERNEELMKRVVSSAFFMLLGMTCVLSVCLALVWHWLDFGALFNVSDPAIRREAGMAMAALAACFLFGMPLTVSDQIQKGFQEGWKSSFWSIGGSLLSLPLVFLAVHLKAGLVDLILIVAGMPVAAQMGNTLYMFGFEMRWLCPDWRMARGKDGMSLLNLGLLFSVMQISAIVSYQLDNLVIARILGPSAVPCYVLTQRLFLLMPTALSFLILPLRPAYSEALARGDRAWAVSTFKRTVRLALILNTGAAIFLYCFAPFIIRVWVGADLVPPTSLLWGSILWLLLQSVDAPLSVFINGIGAVKMMAIIGPLIALANLGFSIFFTYRIGVAGPIFGTLAALSLVYYLPMLFILPKLLKSFLKGENTFIFGV